MTMQMNRDTVLSYVYTPAKFHQDRMKSRFPVFLFCVLVTLTFELGTSKWIQFFYTSLSTETLNLRQIRRKTPEKSCNASRTDFQRLSPRDVDLCPMTLQMHRYTALANVYTPAKFHYGQLKMTEKLRLPGFSILSPCDLDLWPLHPNTALLQVIFYHLAKFEKQRMINGREIV